MKRPLLLVAPAAAIALVVHFGGVTRAAEPPPAWAYPIGSSMPVRDDMRVPPAVPMPAVVARGRQPGVRACANCHLTTGFGRPDTSSLAGLPAVYIEEQMADYRRGVRGIAEPRMRPAAAMAAIAAAITDADLHDASAYFASIPFTAWVRVVETKRIDQEAIGDRIVEVPVDVASADEPGERGFVAYVPPGSVRRGESLVTTGGGGRTVRCGLCHGDDLKGLGPVPGLAGRSPTYAVRQLYDMQQGVRHGLGADLMKATVARLSAGDMLAIAAYLASRRP